MQQAQRQDASRLLEFIHHLNEADRIEDLLMVVRQRIGNFLGVRLYSLFIYRRDIQALELISSSHLLEDIRLPISHPPRTVMDEVIATRRPVVIEDYARSPYACVPSNKIVARYFTPSCVSAPLFFRGQLVGVLNANDKLGSCVSFTEEDIKHITLLGEHLASVLQNHQMLESYRCAVNRLQHSLTELRQTQERLIRSEKRAAVSDLLSGLAHEIRNPLNSMSLLAENILDNFVQNCAAGKDSCAPYLGGIKEEIDRLKRLLDEFLDFARIPTQEPVPVNAAVVLRKAFEVLLPELQSQRIKLFEEFQEDLPPVMGGEEALYRTFINVLLNAVQAMPGGGTLSVRLGREKEDRVCAVFTDTGEGIPKEYLSRIFDPFFTTRPRGTGLGLALVSKYMDTIGGEVRVSSEPGRGSEVRLILPTVQNLDGWTDRQCGS